MRLRVGVLLLAAAMPLRAAGHEFEDLVKTIETHYGVKRAHIPMMGLANLVLGVAQPAGATGFHLALFPDLQSDLDEQGQAELDRFLTGLSSETLRPLIRTRSKGEQAVYVFCGETGKTTQVLIATFQRREATVVEVRVKFETILRWLERPDEAGQ